MEAGKIKCETFVHRLDQLKIHIKEEGYFAEITKLCRSKTILRSKALKIQFKDMNNNRPQVMSTRVTNFLRLR